MLGEAVKTVIPENTLAQTTITGKVGKILLKELISFK